MVLQDYSTLFDQAFIYHPSLVFNLTYFNFNYICVFQTVICTFQHYCSLIAIVMKLETTVLVMLVYLSLLLGLIQSFF